MKNISTLWLVLCLLALQNIAHAQIDAPDPCGPDPQMTSFCQDACVICDIDGYSGTTSSTGQGLAPSDFCTTQQNNINWIAFIAGTENLTLEIIVGNCQNNDFFAGLEIGLYESLDCVNFNQISDCNTDILENTNWIVSNDIPLIVGQYYYFVMDGSGGSVCDWQVNVVSGSTEVGLLNPIDTIAGPTTFCPNTDQFFEVPSLEGANFTEWYLDGDLIYNGGEELTYSFPAEGTYELCYLAYNVCDAIPEICLTVNVENVDPIIIDDFVCEGDTLFLPELDTFFYETGIYNFTTFDQDDCLQQVFVDLEVIPTVFTELDLSFCVGDTVFFGGQTFYESGFYEIPLTTTMMCDSVLLLTVDAFICPIDGFVINDDLVCNGDNDGQLNFKLTEGFLPYTFEWEEELGSGLTGSGASMGNDSIITINNLEAGVYSISVTDAVGGMGIFVGQVFEPVSIAADFEYELYGFYNVSCHDTENGIATVMPFNGLAPYTYEWASGNTLATEPNLAAGFHPITITDAENCSVVVQAEIRAPDTLRVEGSLTHPNCDPVNSGEILLQGIGGNPTYLYAVDTFSFTLNNNFTGFLPGMYTVFIEDANGCEFQDTVEMIEPNTLILELGDDLTLCLGDSIQLDAQVNLDTVSYVWEATPSLGALDVADPYARPFFDESFYLEAFMTNGCSRLDTISIQLEKPRNVYIPNVFSPNLDGVNDVFYVNASKEVNRVLEFEIYDRWGELIHSVANIPANDPKHGWNGTYRGKTMNEGVFLYRAKVLYLDEFIIDYEGDVLLMR